MNPKILVLVLALGAFFALAGCILETPTAVEGEENTITPAPQETIQPGPQGQPGENTPVPSAEKTPLPTPTPEPLQAQGFEVMGAQFELSFPENWENKGSNFYKKDMDGQFTVSKYMHLAPCDDPFPECARKKYPMQGWEELRLENCSSPAITRVSFVEDNSLQKVLWVDFEEEKIGVQVTCTLYGNAEQGDCEKIFESMDC